MSLKVKWPFPPDGKFKGLNKYASRTTILLTSIVAKLGLDALNKMKAYNEKSLIDAIVNRQDGKPILTVSNHMSCVDDPTLFASLLSWKTILSCNPKSHRWALAASDICFTKEWHSQIMAHGQTVPVVRGAGVYQRGMDFAIERLNEGGWVHTFPEGKVRYIEENIRLKWGVGRLIDECKVNPLVIPFYSLGLESILPSSPQGSAKIPNFGKTVTLLVGETMDFSELLQKMRAEKKSAMEIRKAITDIIQDEFAALRIQTEKLHFEKETS